MADNAWQLGKLIEVYQSAGTATGSNERRYRKAPFRVLQWAAPGASTSDTYIVPNGWELPAGFGIAGWQDEQVGMEFGYLTGERIFLEPHMGTGGNNGWADVHSFGYM